MNHPSPALTGPGFEDIFIKLMYMLQNCTRSMSWFGQLWILKGSLDWLWDTGGMRNKGGSKPQPVYLTMYPLFPFPVYPTGDPSQENSLLCVMKRMSQGWSVSWDGVRAALGRAVPLDSPAAVLSPGRLGCCTFLPLCLPVQCWARFAQEEGCNTGSCLLFTTHPWLPVDCSSV